MGVNQFTNSEVLRTDETFEFDLFVRFVEEDINFVHIVQTLVKQHCLDLLLRKELLEFNQPILF